MTKIVILIAGVANILFGVLSQFDFLPLNRNKKVRKENQLKYSRAIGGCAILVGIDLIWLSYYAYQGIILNMQEHMWQIISMASIGGVSAVLFLIVQYVFTKR